MSTVRGVFYGRFYSALGYFVENNAVSSFGVKL